MHCLYLDIVDFLQSKVRQSEDDVHAPQGELGDWIAVQVNVQIIQSPYPRERVYLNQGADVGRTECDGLQQQEINKCRFLNEQEKLLSSLRVSLSTIIRNNVDS